MATSTGSKLEGAKSASSHRLRKTWENIEHRQKSDNERFKWRPASMKGSLTDKLQLQLHDQRHHGKHSLIHGHSAPDLAKRNGEPGAEENAYVVLQQRIKFTRAMEQSGLQYESLEDALFDSRKPQAIRTAAGEVVSGQFPRSSQRWLGVPPRFGDLPGEKYVGTKANPLSKWLSCDTMTRKKQEKDPWNWPVRNYVKICDSIDVKKMTGSHFRYIDNPLAELEEKERRRASKEKSIELWRNREEEEEESSVSSYTTEEEEEEEDSLAASSPRSSSAGTPRIDGAKERRKFAAADAKFQKYITKLAATSREGMDKTFARVESDWRKGMAKRPATQRFLR